MSYKFFRWFACLTFVFAAVLSPASTVFALSFNVNSTVDEVDANPGDGVCATSTGGCSLRAAIQEANATTDDDTITLPAGIYTLSIAGNNEDAAATGDLDITSNLVINGTDSTNTIIDGNTLDRVFHVVNTDNFATISNVTVQNGNSPDNGGGILNAGILAVNNSIVRNNFAECTGSAVYNSGGFSSMNSTIHENIGGGGVCLGMAMMNNSEASMLLNQTVISNNQPDGGLYNYGVIFLFGSTIRDNTGGGFADTPGGIYNFSGFMYINNSTISGNYTSSGGGIFTGGGGEIIIANTTITNNSADSGGGFYNFPNFPSTVYMRNTILAGNTSTSSGPECVGELISSGYNLIGNDTDCTFLSTTGDQVGAGSNPIDPMLGPLQNNGGFTETHALIVGSPAIDGGNPQGCQDPDGNIIETDQRGISSPQSAACDIGAFEFVPSTAIEVIIDIKPGNSRNRIEIEEDDDEKISVAILSIEQFNAVQQVDRTSLTFGATGDENSLNLKGRKLIPDCKSKYVNRDRLPDLVCNFKLQSTGFQIGDTEGILKGSTVDSLLFEGRDVVVIKIDD